MQLNDHSTDAIHFLQIHLGGDRNFCYLLGDGATGEAAAVDPGFEPERLAGIAAERGLRLRHILITHGHSDHAAGAGVLRRMTGAELHAGRADRVAGARPVEDGDRLALGKRTVAALHTPGHSPGHTCYLFEDRLLTGDILFVGKVGGTGDWFPGSSAEQEWHSLRRLLELPDQTRVFPGHDYYGGEGSRQHSSIGWEREHNPFLTCPDFEAFCRLKDNWAEYKREHGIR